MDHDGPILTPALMHAEPAFLVLFGTRDITLRQVLTFSVSAAVWFSISWVMLGSFLGYGPLWMLVFSWILLIGLYASLVRKGEERMSYEEWLGVLLNFYIAPRYYVREDQTATGSADMETHFVDP